MLIRISLADQSGTSQSIHSLQIWAHSTALNIVDMYIADLHVFPGLAKLAFKVYLNTPLFAGSLLIDVASLILTKLDSLLQAHRAPDHTRLALNVTQAVMLQAVWEARNDSRDRNAPADLDRVSRHFGVSLRCCLRSIGRLLPHVMEAWIQAPALFRPCRGVLYFE